MTGARVLVEPNSDRACFFTYVYQFSRKNIKVEFWHKIPGNIPSDILKFVDCKASLENFLLERINKSFPDSVGVKKVVYSNFFI